MHLRVIPLPTDFCFLLLVFCTLLHVCFAAFLFCSFSFLFFSFSFSLSALFSSRSLLCLSFSSAASFFFFSFSSKFFKKEALVTICACPGNESVFYMLDWVSSKTHFARILLTFPLLLKVHYRNCDSHLYIGGEMSSVVTEVYVWCSHATY